jgi:tRNA-intron endonuclease
MTLEGTLVDDAVRVGGDARQRFHDSRGYGRPTGGREIALSYVEAAHLLFRGDLDAVSGMDFRDFFVRATREHARFGLRFLVYTDLRDRGFYLSPARPDWPGPDAPDADFAVFPRGKGPADGAIEHRVRVLGERESVPAADLAESVLAVVDEESEITYLEVTEPALDGSAEYDLPGGVPGVLLEDRVLCWEDATELHEAGFYGQPLAGRHSVVEDAVQLSLVEAASLAAAGVLDLGSDGYDAVVERGRAVEGERFDRRLRTYAELRERGLVPKTGFKFGADFRTYADFDGVDSLGHSEHLVRVVPRDHAFAPRDVSLDVRLAVGVRKRMVFALADANGETDWLSVGRLTP